MDTFTINGDASCCSVFVNRSSSVKQYIVSHHSGYFTILDKSTHGYCYEFTDVYGNKNEKMDADIKTAVMNYYPHVTSEFAKNPAFDSQSGNNDDLENNVTKRVS